MTSEQKVEVGAPADPDETLRKAAAIAHTATVPKPLEHGSDVELAGRAATELRTAFNDQIVFCEGDFHSYNGRCWDVVAPDTLRCFVHRYDGLSYGPRGARVVSLGRGRIDSILRELSAKLSKPQYFAERRIGINCSNGFIDFTGEGPVLLAHDPEHRQRHVLPAEWQGPVSGFSGSLLERVLSGCFLGDPDAAEKIALVGEVGGAAALGYGTRLADQKALVLHGPFAHNGKSQMLTLFRGVLPPGAVSAVPPSKFGDERYLVKLVGKLLNTSDELGSAAAISAEVFKYLVTGNPVSARDLYKSVIDFQGVAQHVFACNQLPSFQGGMDRSILRRLLVLVFNRVIPLEERLQYPHIAEAVLRDELSLLLSFMVEGAERVLRQRCFTVPLSSVEALQKWAQGADPVHGWIAERTIPGQNLKLLTRSAYADFLSYAAMVGAKPISQNTFSSRLRSAGFHPLHSGAFNGFIGVGLRGKVGDAIT